MSGWKLVNIEDEVYGEEEEGDDVNGEDEGKGSHCMVG
jgi:hypothetical protein